MPLLTNKDFLSMLDIEVKNQSQLFDHQIFPQKLAFWGRLLANYPWQSLLLLSFFSSLVTVLFLL